MCALKFGADGLVSAVVIDSQKREVLVVAFMNAGAISATREFGNGTLRFRARKEFWMKGERSGNILTVKRILVDCH